MTKKEAVKHFEENDIKEVELLESLTDQMDFDLRIERWNEFKERLLSENDITENQYNNWDIPTCCK